MSHGYHPCEWWGWYASGHSLSAAGREGLMMPADFNQPLGGNDLPRFAGIATMMRLPHVTDASALDVGFIGIPLDIGTSNRSGARFGPRAIRAESALLRPYNMATRAAPFDSLQVGDL